MTRTTRTYDPAPDRREANLKRYLSSPLFLVALLCFLLPFFAVTCAGGGGIPGLGGGGGGDALVEVTGVDLITGGAEEELSDTSNFQPDLGPFAGPTPIPGLSPQAGATEPVDLGMSQIWAIAAAAIALLGIFLALLAGRAGGMMALILGAGGAILLFLLAGSMKSSIDEAIGQEAAGIITVENRMGFWLALGAFILAAITGLIRLLLPERPAGAMPEAGPSGFGQPAAPPPGAPPAAPPPPESPPQ